MTASVKSTPLLWEITGFYKNEFEFKNDSVEPSYKTSFEFKSVEPSEFVLKKELMEPGQRQRRMDELGRSDFLN